MKNLPVLLLLLSSCLPNQEKALFSDLAESEKVTIVLSTYSLDSIPPAIGQLTKCKELRIQKDSGDWIVYPPLSSLHSFVEKRMKTPPFKKIPKELTNLSQLQRLSLSELNLSELPPTMGSLKELQYLNVSYNKLDIANELSKLAQLPFLTELVIQGNKIDTAKIQVWNAGFPNLKIHY